MKSASRVLLLMIVAFLPIYADAQATVSEPLVITRLLSRGSEGIDVVQLQAFLKGEGLFLYPTTTGFFGPVTEEAVSLFQVKNRIEPVGHVGPLTRLMLTVQSLKNIIAAFTGSMPGMIASPPLKQIVTGGGWVNKSPPPQEDTEDEEGDEEEDTDEEIVTEEVTGLNYRLLWEEDFDSLSLRTGGPTPDGLDSGKGIWAPVGLYYNPGTGDNEKGYSGYGYDWFVNPFYDWQDIDPAFPILGMLDITSEGLVLKGTADYPLIRDTIPVAVESSDGSDLIDGTPNGLSDGIWYDNNGAGGSTGESVDDLPAPRVVTTGGLDYADRESIKSDAAIEGTAVNVKVLYGVGTSDAGFVFIDAGAGQSAMYWNGTTQGFTTGNAGTIENVEFSTVDNHQELTFDITLNNTGDLVVGIGPGSTADGESIIVYDIQLLIGATESQPSFLSSLVSTFYSAKIKPPFYRETVFQFPTGDDDFPAVWGLGNKDFSNQWDKQFEIDDFEFFGDDYPDDYAHHNVIMDTQRGDSPDGYEPESSTAHIDMNRDLSGFIRVGVLVEADSAKFYVDGQLTHEAPYDPDADADQLMHTVLDLSIGHNWKAYPGSYTGTSEMKVRSVAYYAPPSNTTGIFPASPPVPTLTWASGYDDGHVSEDTTVGTVVAVLSGASSYTVLGGNDRFIVDGAALKIANALDHDANATHSFYIEGFDASGMPGIVPAYTVTVESIAH